MTTKYHDIIITKNESEDNKLDDYELLTKYYNIEIEGKKINKNIINLMILEKDIDKNFLFLPVCLNGDYEMFKKIIDTGVNINDLYYSKINEVKLMSYIISKINESNYNEDMFKFMLENMDLKLDDNFSRTFIIYVLENSDLPKKAYKLLINYIDWYYYSKNLILFRELYFRTFRDLFTRLQKNKDMDYYKFLGVNILSEYLEEIDSVIKDGKTLMMMAIEKGNINIVKSLLNKGAKINSINNLDKLDENIIESLKKCEENKCEILKVIVKKILNDKSFITKQDIIYSLFFILELGDEKINEYFFELCDKFVIKLKLKDFIEYNLSETTINKIIDNQTKKFF